MSKITIAIDGFSSTGKSTVAKQIAKQTVDSTKLQKFHEVVAAQPNWLSYSARAKQYYLLNDLKHAEQDILKSIELSPSGNSEKGARKERLFLAQVYEGQKRYAEAIKLYDQFIYNDLDYGLNMLKAIVVRKNNGKYNPPTEDVLAVKSQSKNTTITEKTVIGERKIKRDVNVNRLATSRLNKNSGRGSIGVKKDTIKTRITKPIKKTKSKDSTKSLRSLFKFD